MPDSLLLRAPDSWLTIDAFELLLALADDEFVIGHRHSEWLGLSPFLEEDLTLASIAQDELGHARALYALIWPTWTERDALVIRRPGDQWRSCWLVERENGPWEDSFVRRWIYDSAESLRWANAVERYGDECPGLAEIAGKAQTEERFHQRHAQLLMDRLLEDETARQKLTEAWTRLSDDVGGLVDGLDEAERLNFLHSCADAFGYEYPDLGMVSSPDRSTRRTRHDEFGSIAQSLVDVVRFDPAASW